MARISYIVCDGTNGCAKVVTRDIAERDWYTVMVRAPQNKGGETLNFCPECGETVSVNLARLEYTKRERKADDK